jgi:hypothetical protein
MAACIISVKYLNFAAPFAQAGVSFRVGPMKNEDKKVASVSMRPWQLPW